MLNMVLPMRNSESAFIGATVASSEVRAVRPRRMAAGSPGQQLASDDQVWLRAQVNAKGVGVVAEELGFPRSTIANAAAGAGLRTTTRLVMHDRIAAKQKHETAPRRGAR
jgi:hypothetical protein